jgi:hypothetical protein
MTGCARICALVLAATTTAAAAPPGGSPWGVTPEPEPANLWKPIFGVSLGVEVAVIGYAVYSHSREVDEAKQVVATNQNSRLPLTDADCGTSDVVNDIGGHFAGACTWRQRGITSAYLGLGLGAFVVVSAVLAFRSRPTHRVVAVVPTLTRETAGAQLSLDW